MADKFSVSRLGSVCKIKDSSFHDLFENHEMIQIVIIHGEPKKPHFAFFEEKFSKITYKGYKIQSFLFFSDFFPVFGKKVFFTKIVDLDF